MWSGSEKPLDVKQCIFSWKQLLPGFEIVELNEDSADWFDLKKELQENDWFRAVYERKMWGFVADYVRFKTLYEHGGIWMDTDVSAIKDFSALLACGMILGRENPHHVESAFIGSVKGHPLLKTVLDFYNDKIWQSDIYTSPKILTEVLKDEKGLSDNMEGIVRLDDIAIYPPEYFYPLALKGENPQIGDNSYALHWWKASWKRAEIKDWLNHKHVWGKEKALGMKPVSYKKAYLFGFIPVGRYKYDEKVFSLLGIKLLSFKKSPRKELALLFGFLPLFKLK